MIATFNYQSVLSPHMVPTPTDKHPIAAIPPRGRSGTGLLIIFIDLNIPCVLHG